MVDNRPLRPPDHWTAADRRHAKHARHAVDTWSPCHARRPCHARHTIGTIGAERTIDSRLTDRTCLARDPGRARRARRHPEASEAETLRPCDAQQHRRKASRPRRNARKATRPRHAGRHPEARKAA